MERTLVVLVDPRIWLVVGEKLLMAGSLRLLEYVMLDPLLDRIVGLDLVIDPDPVVAKLGTVETKVLENDALLLSALFTDTAVVEV